MTDHAASRTRPPEELISAALTGDLTDARAPRTRRAPRRLRPLPRDTAAAFASSGSCCRACGSSRAPGTSGARVRAGIEGGRLGVPWWRRPAVRLAGAAALARRGRGAGRVHLGGRPRRPPVASSSAPSASVAPSQSPAASTRLRPPSAPPSPLYMQSGDLAYPAAEQRVRRSQRSQRSNVAGRRQGQPR